MGKKKLQKTKSKEDSTKKTKDKMPLKDNVIKLEKKSKEKPNKKTKRTKNKLSEHTAFKNKDKKKKKKRKAVG